MTPLRQRMLEDMDTRNLFENTRLSSSSRGEVVPVRRLRARCRYS